MFFYELHEGDNEVFSDVLVVSESEWEPDEFFELVQTIRRRIQDSYIHDTLERGDRRRARARPRVHLRQRRQPGRRRSTSRTEESENFLAELEVELADADEDDDDDDDDDETIDEVDYKAVIVDLDPEQRASTDQRAEQDLQRRRRRWTR